MSDSDADFRLAEFLPYRLAIVSNRVSNLIAREYQREFGLTIPQWRVMAVLGDSDALTSRQICEATLMDKMTVSRVVQQLCADGLAARRASQTDGRSSLVALKPKGRAIRRRIIPMALEYEAALLARLSDDDRHELARLLDTLSDAAQALAEEELRRAG